MDKFDEILKNSVEGFEAPYNPQVWENISSQLGNSLDPFEQSMKDSVDKFQAPANPMIWENISSHLGHSRFEQKMKESVDGYEAPFSQSAWEAVRAQLASSSSWKWVGGSAAALLLLLGGAYMITDNENAAAASDNEGVENVIADNNNDLNETTNNSLIADDNNNETGDIDIDNGGTGNINNNELNPIDPNVDNNNIVVVVEEEDDFEDPNDNRVENPTNNNDVVDNDNKENANAENNDQLSNNEETKIYSADFKCDAEACQGSKMIFIADEAERGCEYVWNFGDGNTAKGSTAEHKYVEDGDFDVTLTVYLDRTVLANSEQSITIHRIPLPEFNIETPDDAIPTYTFLNETEAGITINWEIDGVGKTSREHFEMTFREKGTYVVRLTATNEYGCSNSRKDIITIENDYNLLAHNTLVPNDVDDRKRTFMPPALQILDREFVMTIYSKDGSLVYQTRDANQPWDGRYSSDNRMAASGAVYVWIVQLKNANGEMETYKGTVTIL